MTTPMDQVRGFIVRLSPNPVCDACIADRLGFGSVQRANRATRELVGQDGIERHRDICSLCFGEKVVIRQRG